MVHTCKTKLLFQFASQLNELIWFSDSFTLISTYIISRYRFKCDMSSLTIGVDRYKFNLYIYLLCMMTSTFSALLALFVQGSNRRPVNFPHEGQWRGALIFSLICALDKPLNQQSKRRWSETPSYSLLRHSNGIAKCLWFTLGLAVKPCCNRSIKTTSMEKECTGISF